MLLMLCFHSFPRDTLDAILSIDSESRVARLLNQKIQKFYMCSCIQYYYCIKEVRGNAGLIGATGGIFMSFLQ